MKTKLNIKVVSIGGRGINTLDRLQSLEKQSVDRIAIGVESNVFSNSKIKKKITLRKAQNLSIVSDKTSFIENTLEEKRKDIEKAIYGADALFIIGNLANTTTHIQAAYVSRIAKEQGILTFFVGSTAFPFEGHHSMELCEENKRYLEQYIDAVLVIDNTKITTQDITMQEAITKGDTMLGDIIGSLVDLVMKFGIVNVDFADLKTTVQNAGEVFFGLEEGTVEEMDTLIASLFDRSELTSKNAKLQKILYVIYAGKDILMEEVGHIGKKLQEQFDDQARVIFGVVNEKNMKNKLKIVLLGS